MIGFVAIEIICPDEATAGRIAAVLLGRRLVACAHLRPAIRSRYHWRGRIEDAAETPLTLRTRAALFDAVAVRALHLYATPAVVATAIVSADPAYAAWLAAETAGAA